MVYKQRNNIIIAAHIEKDPARTLSPVDNVAEDIERIIIAKTYLFDRLPVFFIVPMDIAHDICCHSQCPLLPFHGYSPSVVPRWTAEGR